MLARAVRSCVSGSVCCSTSSASPLSKTSRAAASFQIPRRLRPHDARRRARCVVEEMALPPCATIFSRRGRAGTPDSLVDAPKPRLSRPTHAVRHTQARVHASTTPSPPWATEVAASEAAPRRPSRSSARIMLLYLIVLIASIWTLTSRPTRRSSLPPEIDAERRRPAGTRRRGP